MSKKNILSFTFIGLILFSIIGVFSLYVITSNNEIKLSNKISAQNEVCRSFYDRLWKILQQKTQVAEKYENSFKEIYPQLIAGRYSQDNGSLMKWITESNPDFDVSLFQDLMTTIESERIGFFNEQKKLIDMNNEHKIMRQTFPNSFFIGSRPDVPIELITSQRTKAVFEIGEENDLNLFN